MSEVQMCRGRQNTRSTIHICTYRYRDIYIYAGWITCIYTSTCMCYIPIHIHACTCYLACTCQHSVYDLCVSARFYMYISIIIYNIYICIYTYIHIHIYIYIYVYILIHACIYVYR